VARTQLPAISTATKYRNTTTTIRHPTRLGAAYSCSVATMVATAGSSGRRGRRFKSCHPDQHHRRSEARTRNGEDLSCCAGPPKGTLRKRRCACSASTQATWSRFGTKRPQGSDSVTRPFPQIADLRECRFLRAVFHSPAITTKASWGTSGMPAPPRQAEEHQPPSTTQQTTRHSRVHSGHCDPPSTTKRSFRAGLPPARNH